MIMIFLIQYVDKICNQIINFLNNYIDNTYGTTTYRIHI